MARFTLGQTVQIRCDIQPGAFPTEYLVTFQTNEGPVSGFVRGEQISHAETDKGYIFATVQGVSEDTLTVMVRGSFFTTTGLAHLSTAWANAHVREAHA